MPILIPVFIPGPTTRGFLPVRIIIAFERGSVIIGTTDEIIAPSMEVISISCIDKTAFN